MTADCVQDRARDAARQYVGTAFNSLGPFGHVANRHVWHVLDTGFLLIGAAIGNDAESRLFQSHEIKESKRLASHQSFPECGSFRLCVPPPLLPSQHFADSSAVI